jgi:hypothetical protein
LLLGLSAFGAPLIMVGLAVLLMGASNGLFTILRGATPQLLFFGDVFVQVSAQLARWGSIARSVLPVAVAFALESALPMWSIALLCTAGIFLGAWWVWGNARAALQ